jgi:tetratricopeptide (TPR) repeat protein
MISQEKPVKAEANEVSASSLRLFWAALLAMVLATAAVFHGVLTHQFLQYDDDTYVLQNPLIYPLTPETIGKMFVRTYFRSYTPLAHLSHAIDFDVWGADPFGHHLTSYLLHLLNAALVFVLAAAAVLVLRTRPVEGHERPLRFLAESLTPAVVLGALFASAFFSLHPLRVESVAWVSDRKDLLMTFFALLSFLSYLLYRLSYGTKPATRWYLASVVAALCAMFAKSVASVIPVLYLLSDLLLFDIPRSRDVWKRVLVEKIPLFAGSALVGAGSLLAISAILPHPQIMERTVLEEVLTPFYTWAFYVAKMVLPLGLTPLYSLPGTVMLLLGLLGFVVVAVLVAMAAWRGVRIPLFVWGFYTLFLLPTMLGRGTAGIQPWADRYSYLPAVAVAVFAGGLVAWVWEKLQGVRNVAAGVLLLVTAGLAVLTYRQVPAWKDTVSLFTSAVEQNPRSIMANTYLGNALTTAGRPDEGIVFLERAIAINDRYCGAYEYMGLAYQMKGDQGKAVESFQRAVLLDTNLVEAYSNLGNSLYALGEYDRAIQQYREALRRDPDFSDACHNLGVATYARGDTASALAIFRKAAEINPNSPDTYASMGIIYSGWGMEDSAAVEFRRAADLGHAKAKEWLRSRRHR